ncbi:MAG: right-handed parallel beta-helix repeat-containing protein [Rhodocyclaceae bacterium]
MKARIDNDNTVPLKIGGGLLCALFAMTSLGLYPMPAEAESFPPASPYLGEIRRDSSGKLIVVPDKAPVADAAGQPASGAARILRVGPQQALRSIAVAATQARDGDTVEIEAGDYLADVAVWKQHKLTIRGVGGYARMLAGGVSAEKKAIWIIRGGDITIENVEFVGARVPDKNGAGIRFERGRLFIRNCRFLDNEMGILSGSGDGELDIENSEFGHNGVGDGYSHNLYVGAIKKLRVTGSYFHHARVGHLLKSRAAENHILYNRLTDESGGHASYELEFPNGGIAYVIGNIIEQARTTENPNIVSFGAEGYKHSVNALYLINNTLIDNLPQSGVFLAIRPGFHVVKAWNNLLLGRRPLNSGGIDGEFINNPNITANEFVLADRHDYRIRRDSTLHRGYRAPAPANDVSLAPEREYVHPAATRRLATLPTLPGARQTLQPDNAP